ncbi:MAG: rod shape-determining protein MreD [Clostridiales bacterium]
MMLYVIPYLFYSCLGLLGIFFQAEFFSYLTIFGVKPDLLLIIAVAAGIHSGRNNGAVVGAIVGFWADLLIGGTFGIHILTYGLLGYLMGALGQKMNFKTYPGIFFANLFAGLLSGFIFCIIFGMTGTDMHLALSLGGIIVPYTFYNCLLVTLSFPLIFLYRRFRGLKIGFVDMFGGGIVLVTNNDKVNMEYVEERKDQNRRNRKKHNKKNNHQQKSLNNDEKKYKEKTSKKHHHNHEKNPKANAKERDNRENNQQHSQQNNPKNAKKGGHNYYEEGYYINQNYGYAPDYSQKQERSYHDDEYENQQEKKFKKAKNKPKNVNKKVNKQKKDMKKKKPRNSGNE